METGYLSFDLTLRSWGSKECRVFHLPANNTEFSGFLLKRLTPPPCKRHALVFPVSPDSFGGQVVESQ